MCFVFQNFGCHCSCLLSCRVPHFATPAGRRFDAFTFIYGTIRNLTCRAHLDFARCLVLIGNHRGVDAGDSFGMLRMTIGQLLFGFFLVCTCRAR